MNKLHIPREPGFSIRIVFTIIQVTQQCATHHTPRMTQFSSLSRVRLLGTPGTAAASLSITNSRSSLRLMSIESVMPSSHPILCHPLLLLPPIPPSIRVFSSESTLCMRWPKYWSFSFSISPSNEHPGLISFRMGWLDVHAVQGTLESLLQHQRSKASILWSSAFFTVQLSQINSTNAPQKFPKKFPTTKPLPTSHRNMYCRENLITESIDI